MLESCGENSQLDTISISSNLTDKKIKIDDTLKIKLSKGSKNLTFEIKSNNQIHVLNSPSPAATSSLAIADYIIKNYIN